jgi:hypothetical protein
MFELDEDKRITMHEIQGHPWFTTPLTEEYRTAMNDILAEQKKLDYLMRRHGVRCTAIISVHKCCTQHVCYTYLVYLVYIICLVYLVIYRAYIE